MDALYVIRRKGFVAAGGRDGESLLRALAALALGGAAALSFRMFVKLDGILYANDGSS